MKLVKLAGGLTAIVDDEDFELVSRVSWAASRVPTHRTKYAVGWMKLPGGGRKRTSMHRLILGLTAPSTIVDHVNHDGLDNRRANLRTCSISDNGKNRRKQSSSSSSRFKGVTFSKSNRCWQAYIKVKVGRDVNRVHLGCFKDEVAAGVAYDAAAIKHYGQFAHINFPEVSNGCH